MNTLSAQFSPEILSLMDQSRDIRFYLNEMEIMGDLWSQKDLEYYMYIESLLIEIEEELHYLQVNEIF